ncbi:tetratricopeptide repeat protein [Dolichospermum sp. LEGE 00240]|uniref:tetratricopeptide repeat protein n=1 Tax=Dolichospermum sp. LEGE 00240 TaxID=1828603 RepID=UPI001881C787|nr:tetratricopeptide repeat protein [Dolichospermum sp. LEGE 00240]MBE9248974.1 tetratricopeptide repeat protein [Dolichospermum sp. LEGE 00240]MDM3853514.1 tetratricopeptide repeat protein [Aphanizomenon gracile PMC649.10]MDM3859417.1 tetratricopeptide repeat protein [Aphanizomenon gracile PMC644.10]
MTNSSDDYLVRRGKQIERKKRIVTYIGLISFGGSILFGGVNAIKQSWEKPQQAVVQTAGNDLQTQMKGYELVLQREPNNQMALERLSIMRLRSGDNQGGIALIEKLIKLHPDREDYKAVLADVKKKMREK